MITAPLGRDEPLRLAALKSYAVLDTAYEPVFDAITRLAATICGVPIALISLVDHDRQWFKSVQGLPGVTQTPRDLAFCAHAILGGELMEVADAALDQRFHDNPLVTGDPMIRFYAGMPLVDLGGYGLGTLCVIDRHPRTLNEHQRAMLGELAVVVMKLLESRRTEVRAGQLGALLQQSIGHIYVADAASLRIEEASKGALSGTGYTETDIRERLLTDLLADFPGGIGQRPGLIVDADVLDERMIETRCTRRDGSQFPLQLSVNTVRAADGSAQALICVGLDASERQRHEAMLRNLVREKEALLREVYHRVKNNLQVIVSLLQLQIRTMGDEQARTALRDTSHRVRAMSLIHEKLYQSGDLSSIAMDTYIKDLAQHLANAAGAAGRGIQLQLDLASLRAPLDLAVSLGLLINELIANSFKHAFPDGRQGRIRVSLRKAEGDSVVLEVADDGIGPGHGAKPAGSSSLGLKLVATLSRQLGGQLETDHGNGFRTRLEFSLVSSEKPRI